MVKNIAFLSAVILLLTVAVTSCEEVPVKTADVLEKRQIPGSIRDAVDGVAEGNNRFALDLYGRLRKEEGNLFLSPFSVSTAFAMAYAGAEGATEAEMRDVFRFMSAEDRLHPAFGALMGSLETGADFGGYRLNVANRLWGKEGFGLAPGFLQTVREHYRADLVQLDFSDSRKAAGTINSWVEEKTRGKIEDLIPPGAIDPYTRLVLTNAIYFKGLWLDRFDEEATENAAFHLGPDRTVTVPMMHQKEEFRTGHGEGVKILELPYRTGDLSMIFILPEEKEGLAGVEGRLSVENLRGWMDTLSPVRLDVWIPRFRIQSRFSLKQTLKEMGMPSAFTEAADFSGINPDEDLFIQDAVHKAYVEVNEEGTEAAAATGITLGITSLPPTFRADHPFLILIWDRVTGSILFLGRVADPSAGVE